MHTCVCVCVHVCVCMCVCEQVQVCFVRHLYGEHMYVDNRMSAFFPEALNP